MAGETDRATVGLSAAGQRHLEAVMESRWFSRELDAYRVAIAVATARDLSTDGIDTSGKTTKFNVGTLDDSGRIRQLVASFASHETGNPYEYAEKLAEVGFEYVAKALSDNRMLADILSQPDDASMVTQ